MVIFEPFFFVTVIIPVDSSKLTSATSVDTSVFVALLESSDTTRLSMLSIATSILFKFSAFSAVLSLG